MKAFVIMGRALKAVYDELFLCVFLSVVWWIGTVLIVTAAPVTNGLNHVANRAANYKRVDSSFFWEGARTQIGRSWLLYAISIAVPILLIVNIVFYFSAEGFWRFLGVLFIWLLILAFMMGQYIYPLFWQQDERDIRLVLRNAALLALRYPLYTFLLLLFQIVMVALSAAITLPLFLLAPAVVAMTANFGLNGILQDMGLAPMPPVVPKR